MKKSNIHSIKQLSAAIVAMAVVLSAQAISCLSGTSPQNCTNSGGSCTYYDGPGCGGAASYGLITTVGVNQVAQFTTEGQPGTDGSSSLEPCVSTCTASSDCNGVPSSGTVSIDYNYWRTSSEICNG